MLAMTFSLSTALRRIQILRPCTGMLFPSVITYLHANHVCNCRFIALVGIEITYLLGLFLAKLLFKLSLGGYQI